MRIKRPSPQKFTNEEKKEIIELDKRNSQKSFLERKQTLENDLIKGKISKIQFMAMTPIERLQLGLITPTEYRKQVFKDDSQLHPNSPFQLDDVETSYLKSNPPNFRRKELENLGNYSTDSFDIDRKIEDLFKV